jgi:hypothetical protein
VNKKWPEKLAAQVENKYGQKVRDRIFGDIPPLPLRRERDEAWLRNLVRGVNDLNDVDYLKVVDRNTRHLL